MSTDDLADARDLVQAAQRVFVLTGAGISTAAGIPDFRGPQGLWTLDPKAELISDIDHYLYDDEVRAAAWQRRAAQAVWQAQPTAAHRALADFEQSQLERGRHLLAIATQNTDGLHQAAGSSDELVHEVHGNARLTRCEDCGHLQPTADVVARVQAGEPDPRCQEPGCGGVLRATVILFGEMLVREVLDACVEAAVSCDLVVAIGSTLSVQPVAGLVPYAIAHGAKAVIVNAEATEYDQLAHARVWGDIEQVVPELFRP
ncbi:SIR2 family NAD-dependent protein deacylase [Aestuariimicrobium ganziense]|uniref:SIR2 family NAD-dependent protein deacylase n=1 Tax=Aestuariimicrobium ganziense TaxID=2773677 RepID=UPI001942BA57|nr:Sir2 family NAD-dependent protein deacetylase [Aestuariimicrobium ganziense]